MYINQIIWYNIKSTTEKNMKNKTTITILGYDQINERDEYGNDYHVINDYHVMYEHESSGSSGIINSQYVRQAKIKEMLKFGYANIRIDKSIITEIKK